MNHKIVNFTDLIVWQEAHKLVLFIYNVTLKFPKHELFGLISQMRRSAVSITSNIAEGYSRRSYKEKLQFYYISASSLTELQNQVIISKDVGHISEEDYLNFIGLSVAVHKLINAFIKSTKIFLDSRFKIRDS